MEVEIWALKIGKGLRSYRTTTHFKATRLSLAEDDELGVVFVSGSSVSFAVSNVQTRNRTRLYFDLAEDDELGLCLWSVITSS